MISQKHISTAIQEVGTRQSGTQWWIDADKTTITTLLGNYLVAALSRCLPGLKKNPHEKKRPDLILDGTITDAIPLEVKGTCGANITLSWSAHHRNTKLLLAFIWDFVSGVPTITAVYVADLQQHMWRIVSERPNGESENTPSTTVNAAGKSLLADGVIYTRDATFRDCYDKRLRGRGWSVRNAAI